MEGMAAMEGYGLPSLSEQEVTSCAGINGCNGGNAVDVWNWATTHGIDTEQEYPYENCGLSTTKACTPGYQNAALQYLASNNMYSVVDETSLKNALMKGPVSIAVSAGNSCFQGYSGGILSCDCPTSPLDHAITVVGWGTNYWIVRNQWGTGWGEQGYIMLPMEGFPGACGMFGDAAALSSIPAPISKTPQTYPIPPSPGPRVCPTGCYNDGELCGVGTTCNNCCEQETYWYSLALTACGKLMSR